MMRLDGDVINLLEAGVYTISQQTATTDRQNLRHNLAPLTGQKGLKGLTYTVVGKTCIEVEVSYLQAQA